MNLGASQFAVGLKNVSVDTKKAQRMHQGRDYLKSKESDIDSAAIRTSNLIKI
jgi:hypothetical protein